MKGEHMAMADMGYVVIDRVERIRVRKIDREFGDHATDILGHLERMRSMARAR